MRKMLNKIDKGLLVGLPLSLVLAGIFLWFVFLREYIPNTKINFRNYNSFHNKMKIDIFPDELPTSVRDIRYYYYTGYNDSKAGIAFIVEDETEYKKFKDAYLSEYLDYIRSVAGGDNIQYVFDQPLTDEFLQKEEVEFLKELLENNINDYQIQGFQDIDQIVINRTDGVLYNDFTNEIIIFYFLDKHS